MRVVYVQTAHHWLRMRLCLLPTAEAKASYRRRGGQPLLVENDLKLARFLAGLHVSAVFLAAAAFIGCRRLLLVESDLKLARFLAGLHVSETAGRHLFSSSAIAAYCWPACERFVTLGWVKCL